MLAEALVEAGHEVTWWVSGFNHRSKSHRAREPKEIVHAPGFTIRLVPTHPYSKNISLARIRAEREYSRGVLRLAAGEPVPDVVMISEPSLFYSDPAIQTVRRTGAALVLDTLDLWPEMFHIALPSWMQRFGRLVFAPLYHKRKRTFARADAVLAASRDYRALSQRLAPHLPAELVQTVYFGVHVPEFRETMRGAGPVPDAVSAPRRPGEVRLVYASTLGSNYDVETLLAAAERLTAEGIAYRLFIAGTGPLEPLIVERLASTAMRDVTFLGNPDASTMARIYARCDVGIAGYVAGSQVTMPIKGFHYCAAGLAVVTSLAGEYADLLLETGAGTRYVSGGVASLAECLRFYATHATALAAARAASYALGDAFDVKVQYAKAVQVVERAAELPGRRARAGHRAL